MLDAAVMSVPPRIAVAAFRNVVTTRHFQLRKQPTQRNVTVVSWLHTRKLPISTISGLLRNRCELLQTYRTTKIP